MITETIEQTIIDYSSNIVQEVIIQEETISELGQIGHGVASGGTTGQVLAKKTDTNYDTEWVTNSGGGGGISDAPNNVNAYVRSGLAWVIGYTKTAIDALISGFQTAGQVQTIADTKVSDTAYDATSWNGVTGVAPSKNAVRDKFFEINTDIDDISFGITAKEDSINKSTSVVTDQASNVKFPSVKSVYDWAISVFTTTSAVASQITTALTGYATQSWVNSQGYITNVITALGFTPYNATNPSGYQTLAQVNAKISDDAWEVGAEGLTNIASSQNAVFNGIANVFVYAEYLDDNKQPLAAVLSNTTASFTTADETKLDGIATGATANDTDANLKARANHTGTQTASTISDLNSVSRAQTEAELLAGANITITPSGTGASRQLTIASTGGSSAIGAFKMLANNTNASAVPTEQVYKDVAEQSLSGTGMIATGGALPTGTNTHFFRWSQKGNLVTVRINLQFQTAGTCSGIAIPFANMADIPQIPQHANIYAGAGDVIIYGAGNLNNTKTFPLFTTAMGLSGIRIKTIGTPNTYEFVVGRTSSSYNNGWIHIQYYI